MYLESFKPSGFSFEDRVGEPESFDAAVGRIAMAFSYLEDALAESIKLMLKVPAPEAAAVTAEMSFANKVHLFSSLVRIQLPSENFNFGTRDPSTYLRELVAACFKAEELRNTVLHSSRASDEVLSSASRRRRKTTAKASRGLVVKEEVMTAGDALDIYDYTIYVAVELEEFLLTYGESQ